MGRLSPRGRVSVMAESNAFMELLTSCRPALLGPESRSGVLRSAELERRLEALFRQMTLPKLVQQLVRALILLWHDHLEAAHTICQGIETPDGSLVHAIMHRREPDSWNSKYWWRRVGQHPCFPELAKRVTVFLKLQDEQALLAELVPQGGWDALAFVDACEQVASRPDVDDRAALLREVQRIEFETALGFFLGGKPH